MTRAQPLRSRSTWLVLGAFAVGLLFAVPTTIASPTASAAVRIVPPYSSTVGAPSETSYTTFTGCSWERFPAGPSFNATTGRLQYHLTGGARSCAAASYSELRLDERTTVPIANWTPSTTGTYSALFRFVATGFVNVSSVHGASSTVTSQLDWYLVPMIYQGSFWYATWGTSIWNSTNLNDVTAVSLRSWSSSIASYVNGTFKAGTKYTLGFYISAFGDFESFSTKGNLAQFDVDFGGVGHSVDVRSIVVH